MRLLAGFSLLVFAGMAAVAQPTGSGSAMGGGAMGSGSYGNNNNNTFDNHTVPEQPRRKTAPSKEDILQDATALAKSIALPCEVSDAALINDGTGTVNGKEVHVRTFETACKSGIGYFLVEQAPEPVAGFSCFAAEATRAADAAAGRPPGPVCSLSANTDVKVMAKNVLSGLGKSCNVTGLRSMGQQTSTQSELTEIACSGGTGYVLLSALPGSTKPLAAESCADAYKRGIACTMSATGAVTADTFKTALTQHNVPCSVEATHVIGRETVKQRYVVEFRCKEQPNGLVAFIPAEGATAPFESMDCTQAGARARIICTLTQPH